MKNSILVTIAAFCAMLVNSSIAQTAAADNKISQSGTFRPIHLDATVFGVFQGRPACTGTANQLGVEIPADCDKLKWSLTLYRDSVTNQPATYELTIVGGGDVVRTDGGPYRMKIIKGKWSTVKGTRSSPDAEVYELELPKPGKSIHLLKGDENVLFVLDENRNFLVGDMDFSYTLNRVELVRAKK